MKLLEALPNHAKWKEKKESYKTSRDYYTWYYSYMQELLSKNKHLFEIDVTIDEEELDRILAW